MRSLFCLLLVISLTGCKSDTKFELSKIEGFPSTLIGCSCYYAVNEAEFAAQKFIYIDSYGEKPGTINIDGNLIAVDPKNTNPQEYQFQFEIEKEIQLDQEKFHKEGVLTVTSPEGAVFTTPFYGECGC